MKKFLLPIILMFIAGCSIIGIHFKIHNPKRAGKYPEKTEARVLLGNQDTKFRTCYDVKWYNLSVVFDNSGKKFGDKKDIQVLTEMTFEALTDFDTMQIDLAENMELYALSLNDQDGIEVADLTKRFVRHHQAVLIYCPVKKGQVLRLSSLCFGTPSEAKHPPWSGGFVWKKDDLGNPWDGVACETEGASLWWPCKDVMNDEPDSADIRLSVPGGLTGVSNGSLRLDEQLGGFHVTYWHVSYPINIYNITFYIGNYKLLHDTYYSEVTHDTLQLNHYVLVQNYDKAVTHFQQLKKYLAFYEQTFGPYPWYRDGFKLVESPYAGMEHQSAIAYGNGYKDDPRNGFDYIILHETAHEWWGNSVTANDLADGWLHEGFATYAEALYVEKTKGHEAYLNYLLQDRLLIVNRRPIVGEEGIRYFNYHDGDIYMKGAWVLHSLRYAINDDSLFFDIIHSFYKENTMKDISSDKLQELVNRKTGKDFHWFFEQYLYNRFTPELEYYVKNGTMYYRWNKTKDDFQMIAKVQMFGYKTSWTTLPASSGKINSISTKDNNGIGNFNDDEFLYKPVENKNLVKEFEKQQK